jgi:ketosteroid isomerase-like protein
VTATREETATTDAIDRFNEAFNRHDVDAVMAAMTEDCVFEGTGAPDGQRYTGREAVRGAWKDFFAGSPDAHFETEEMFAAGDRCIVRWLYQWGDAGNHVRAVDIMRVRDGKVAEKLAHVKG